MVFFFFVVVSPMNMGVDGHARDPLARDSLRRRVVFESQCLVVYKYLFVRLANELSNNSQRKVHHCD
jgi:hypothetical protein